MSNSRKFSTSVDKLVFLEEEYSEATGRIFRAVYVPEGKLLG